MAAAFVLQTPANSSLICLCALPAWYPHCQGSSCSLPAAFLFLWKGAGRYICEASIVSKNGGQRPEAELWSFMREQTPQVKIKWTSNVAISINTSLAVSYIYIKTKPFYLSTHRKCIRLCYSNFCSSINTQFLSFPCFLIAGE